MNHAFWYISLSSLPDYDVKLLNFTFCGACEHTTMTFFFLFLNFNTVFKNSSPQKNCQHLTNWTKWNKRDKVWSSATSLFKGRFRSCRRRCCYKVPNIKRFLAAKLPLFQASTNFERCHAAAKIAKNWRNRRFCWHWKIQVLEGVEGGPIKSTISAIFPIFLKIAKNWRNRRIS